MGQQFFWLKVIRLMKYTPKKVESEVNVSRSRPEVDFVVLLAGLAVVLLITHFVLGLASSFAVNTWPDKVDNILGKLITLEKDPRLIDAQKKYSGEREYLQGLADAISEKLYHNDLKVQIFVAECEYPNAFAFPGGRIIMCRKFLGLMGSENETTMILGHEMGHIHNRDHLRVIGRSLTSLIFHTLLNSSTDFGGEVLTSGSYLSQLVYSREQEYAADEAGIRALIEVYGHAAGAVEIFARMQKTEVYKKIEEKYGSSTFMTHPLLKDRIERLKGIIKQRSYSVKKLKSGWEESKKTKI